MTNEEKHWSWVLLAVLALVLTLAAAYVFFYLAINRATSPQTNQKR